MQNYQVRNALKNTMIGIYAIVQMPEMECCVSSRSWGTHVCKKKFECTRRIHSSARNNYALACLVWARRGCGLEAESPHHSEQVSLLDRLRQRCGKQVSRSMRVYSRIGTDRDDRRVRVFAVRTSDILSSRFAIDNRHVEVEHDHIEPNVAIGYSHSF